MKMPRADSISIAESNYFDRHATWDGTDELYTVASYLVNAIDTAHEETERGGFLISREQTAAEYLRLFLEDYAEVAKVRRQLRKAAAAAAAAAGENPKMPEELF